MKFDFCIGNPPYQESQDSNNKSDAVYPYFYDAAEDIADRYLMISPGRFLFNAGLTSKDWNKKMLSDEHLQVKEYYANGADVFPNTDIKGGVVIVSRNVNKVCGPIGEFIPDENLRNLAKHFVKDEQNNLPSIMHGGRSDLKISKKYANEHPEIYDARLKAIQSRNPKVVKLAPNEECEIKSSAFDVLPFLFEVSEPTDKKSYYRFLGLSGGKREYRWIKREMLVPRSKDNNLEFYKLLIPKASGNGRFGEVLSEPVIAYPGDSSTPTFISLGMLSSVIEAENAKKYIRTKLVRALLGILKITQDIVPSKWAYVPIQDFTVNSDIDWSVSIHDIDKQLYKKYNLSNEEINFIETNVKEMK